MPTSVWAVVTAFHPEGSLGDVVSSLRGQVGGVVVVDDGSGPSAAYALRVAQSEGAHVIELAENRGIASALNEGIGYAISAGADTVVTFDQDSRVGAGFIDSLVATQRRIDARRGASGPVVPEFFADVRQARRVDESGFLLTENSIQSGMLIPRRVLDRVGPLREDLFIDLVDTEFEMRCAAAGLPVHAAPGLRLQHRLGARYRRRGRLPLPMPSVLTLSSPFRYFYRIRNRVRIEREYRGQFLWRLARDGLTDRIYFGFALMLARPQRAMWTILSEGYRAGRRGAGGPIPPRLAAIAAGVSWHADRIDDPPA